MVIYRINRKSVLFFLLFLSISSFFSLIVSYCHTSPEIRQIGSDQFDMLPFINRPAGPLELNGLSEVRIFEPPERTGSDGRNLAEAEIHFNIGRHDFLFVGFVTDKDVTYAAVPSTSSTYQAAWIRLEGARQTSIEPWKAGVLSDSGSHVLKARFAGTGISVQLDNRLALNIPGSGDGQRFRQIILRKSPNGSGVSIQRVSASGTYYGRPFQWAHSYDRRTTDILLGIFMGACFCALLAYRANTRKSMSQNLNTRSGIVAFYSGVSLLLGFVHIVLHAAMLIIILIYIGYPAKSQRIDLEKNYRKIPPWKDRKAVKALVLALLLFIGAFGLESFAKYLLPRAGFQKSQPFSDKGSENISYHQHCIDTDFEPPYELSFKGRTQGEGLLRVDLNRSKIEETAYMIVNAGGSQSLFSSFFMAPGSPAVSTTYSQSYFVAATRARSNARITEDGRWFDAKIRIHPPFLTVDIDGSGGSVGRGSIESTSKICFLGFNDRVGIADIIVKPLDSNFVGLSGNLSDAIRAIASLLFILVVSRFVWRLLSGTLSPEMSLWDKSLLVPVLPLMTVILLDHFFLRNNFNFLSTAACRYGELITIIFAYSVYSAKGAKYAPGIPLWRKLTGFALFAVILIWMTPFWLPGPMFLSYFNSVTPDLPILDMCLTDPSVTYDNSLLYQQRFAAKKIDPDLKTTRRVFLFGGSQVYGIGVNGPKATISEALERILNQRYGYLGRFETGNAARPGGTLKEVLVNLEKVASHYNPEIVIFSTIFNDFHFKRPTFEDYRKYHEMPDHEPGVPLLFEPLIRHYRITVLLGNFGVFSDYYKTKQYLRNFSELCRLSRSLGLRFAFVYEPFILPSNLESCTTGDFCVSGLDTYDNSTKGHKLIRKLAGQEGADIIDVLTPTIEHRYEYLYVDKIHFNENGQDLFASTLADFIASKWPNPPAQKVIASDN